MINTLNTIVDRTLESLVSFDLCLSGVFMDMTGNYDTSFYLSGGMILISGVMCYPLSRIKRWEQSRAKSQMPLMKSNNSDSWGSNNWNVYIVQQSAKFFLHFEMFCKYIETCEIFIVGFIQKVHWGVSIIWVYQWRNELIEKAFDTVHINCNQAI